MILTYCIWFRDQHSENLTQNEIEDRNWLIRETDHEIEGHSSSKNLLYS